MIRLFFLALLPVILLGLTACGGAPPVSEAVLVAESPTVTPGGMILMVLPTPTPVTPTPPPGPAPQAAPGYVLTVVAGSQTAICPRPGNPRPPAAPAAYNLYTTAITQYLSAGGTVPMLGALLTEWGALDEGIGLVSDAYDLTGDGVYEVLVILADPFNAGIAPRPGQILVFGCHQEDYRLLYGSEYGPGFGIPTLLYVGDMNANAGTELVYVQQRCQSGSCVQAAQVLSWSAPNDGFIALNVDTVGSADGRFSIADLDNDRVQEIMIQGGGISSAMSAGPPRSSTTIWDWNGLNYVRALTRLDPPLYRIHVIHDADRALESGDGEEAIRLYREALDNPRLGTWQVPNEQFMLRGYAQFKLIVAYAYLEDDLAALDAHSVLMAEHTPGLPSYVYALVGDAFWSAYQATHNLHTACVAAATAASQNPQAVLFLNSYGPANRAYQVPDICTF
ncbi:MAG: hypothetical protein HPY64_03720 [Anaerolineae bacterium]|nr:hypothetical protein [Anaerolineae bacterium]